MQTKF